MSNTVSVSFQPGTVYTSATAPIWQYDYGKVLAINGAMLPTMAEIHFSLNSTGGIAERRIGYTVDGATRVAIPDKMLENGDVTQDYDIYAFIYNADQNGGETTYKICLHVRSRPRPEDYETKEEGAAVIFSEAVAIVCRSVDEAESWARGHEEYPERNEDNARFYAGVAEENAQAAAGSALAMCFPKFMIEDECLVIENAERLGTTSFALNTKGELEVNLY